MPLSPAELESHFDSQTLAHARGYLHEDRVQDIELLQNGSVLVAQVRGSDGQYYRTQVSVRGTELDTRCSCSEGQDCKHAASLLLAHWQNLQSSVQGTLALDELSAWGQALTECLSQPAAEEVRKHVLIYRLSPCNEGQRRMQLRAEKVYLRRDGRFGEVKAYAVEGAAQRQRPAFIKRNQWDLLRQLSALCSESPYAATLDTAGSASLLDALVEAGQVYWEQQDKPLSLSPLQKAEPAWDLQQDGSQRLQFVTTQQAEVLPTEPLRYVDTATQQYGPVQTDFPPQLASLLAQAPQVPIQQLPQLEALLAQHSGLSLPRPNRPHTRKVDQAGMQPVLELMHVDDLQDSGIGHFRQQGYVARAQIAYGAWRFNPAVGEATARKMDGGTLYELNRDFEAELAILDDLQGFVPMPLHAWDDKTGDRVYQAEHDEQGWLQFLQQGQKKLEKGGWLIEQRESFDLVLCEVQQWILNSQSQDDWMQVSLECVIDGKKLNLLPLLVQLLESRPRLLAELQQADQTEDVPLRLDDRRIVLIPVPRLQQVLQVFAELQREKTLNRRGELKLHRLDAPRLADLSQDWAWEGSQSLRNMGQSLREQQPQAQLPHAFEGTLRPYQKAGLAWMQHLRRQALGGVLADDMGLGKTVQTLAHLAYLYEQGETAPSLIVAPTSVIANWVAEAAKFTPQLSCCLWHGSQRGEHLNPQAQLIVTSYGTLLRDHDLFAQQNLAVFVLDEAQYIKNPRARISKLVREIDASQKLCLSGTPMENHLGELWSLFDFLAPGFLGDERSFQTLYRKPIEKQGDEQRAEHLRGRIRSFVLRRRKDEVATELPPKTQIVQHIPLSHEQADVYEHIRGLMQQRLQEAVAEKGFARSQIMILDALLKLRQVCCDPRLLKLDAVQKAESAKLAAVMDMLPALIAEGRRILLFSQFTEMLALIEDAVQAEGIDYLKLTGSSRNRGELVQRFQDGEAPLFLISLKAGGTGLNLTAADTVIHYDPWWNPAVENQATDRAHRIGQDKPVFVYKLICQDTVEERIQALQERKQGLADQLYSQDNSVLSEEDLALLLSPQSA